MSLGYGGLARKTAENEQSVIYSYGGYNWNIEKYHNENKLCDGEIEIKKCALPEPAILEITKKVNGKRKTITKRIEQAVDYNKLLSEEKISVKNCSNCWKFYSSTQIDISALILIKKIFSAYQQDGHLPKTAAYFQ